jgi:dipeptidyl aminopeptidase/acylaminoacyl peptidase
LGVVSNLQFSADENHLSFSFQGPRHNSDVWIWNLNEPRSLRQLTFSSRAGLSFKHFVEPTLIRYETFDGRLIPAWFYKPDSFSSSSSSSSNEQKSLPPAIVYPHGGPEG